MIKTTSADMALAKQLPAVLMPTFTLGGTYYDALTPTVTEQRSVDANITLICARTQVGALEISVETTLYRDFPVAEYAAYFKNTADTDSELLCDPRLTLSLALTEPVLAHGIGDTQREDGYNWDHDRLTSAVTLAPVDGTSCNGAFPYMRLLGDTCGYSIAIGWPARWSAELKPTTDGASVSAGLKRCHTVLRSGEVIRTPRLTVLAFDGNEARGINLWRNWYISHLLPKKNGAPLSPLLCMHYHGCENKPEHTAATEENQINAIEIYKAQDIHPDVWWLDAGWYKCDYEWHLTGTWKPDTERFPNGFAPLGEACEKNGMDFLLWFEPERVRKDTELYDEHPEWVLKLINDDGTEAVNSLLDYSNPDAVDFIIERVDSIIKEGGVKIYRQDFNMNPAPIWDRHEADDRIGATENLHAQGYLRFWDTILARNPGLIIDSCASGGRRNDLETMRRAVTLHYTDVGYGNHPIKQLQHARMFEWLPYFRAHNMNWLEEDGSYSKKGHPADRFAYYAAFAPSLTDMLHYTADSDAYALAKLMQPIWRKCAELELCGDYYALTECRKSNEDFYAVQFHDSEHECGFVQAVANSLCTEGHHTAALRGLDADAEYVLTLADDGECGTAERKMSGRELMAGITFDLPAHTAQVWFYKKA